MNNYNDNIFEFELQKLTLQKMSTSAHIGLDNNKQYVVVSYE